MFVLFPTISLLSAWKLVAISVGALLLLNTIVTIVLSFVVCKKQTKQTESSTFSKRSVSRMSSNSSQLALFAGMPHPSSQDYAGIGNSFYDKPKKTEANGHVSTNNSIEPFSVETFSN